MDLKNVVMWSIFVVRFWVAIHLAKGGSLIVFHLFLLYSILFKSNSIFFLFTTGYNLTPNSTIFGTRMVRDNS